MIYLRGRDVEKTADETKGIRQESEEDKEESVDKRRNRISIDTYIYTKSSRMARGCKVGFIFHRRPPPTSFCPFRRSLRLVGDSRDEIFYGHRLWLHKSAPRFSEKSESRGNVEESYTKLTLMYIQRDIGKLLVFIRTYRQRSFKFSSNEITLFYFIFELLRF